MRGRGSFARGVAAWPIRHWRGSLAVLLLAPVLGPAVAVYCLAAGAHAIDKSSSPQARGRIRLRDTLGAVAAAVVPAAVYGCAVWALRAVAPSSHWVSWIIVLEVAGLVGVVAGFLPAMYVFGYSLGVAEATAAPSRLRSAGPSAPRRHQVLRPFRRPPPGSWPSRR